MCERNSVERLARTVARRKGYASMGGKTQGRGVFAAGAEKMATDLMRQSGKTRKAVFAQLGEALKTGGIEARTPIIQNAVEQGLSQGSESLRAAQEGIVRAGAARSPYAKESMAMNRSTVERAVASIPSEIIGQSVMNAPGQVGQATNAMIQLQGVAQQGEALSQAAKAQNYANQMALIGGGINGLISTARSAYGGYGGGG